LLKAASVSRYCSHNVDSVFYYQHYYLYRHVILIYRNYRNLLLICLIKLFLLQCRLGSPSRYSDSLRSGPSGDRTPRGEGSILHPSRPAVRTIQTPIQYIPGHSLGKSPRGKGGGVNHPPLYMPKLKEEYNYTSTPPLCLLGGFTLSLSLTIFIFR
jgi:hypothetical protein